MPIPTNLTPTTALDITTVPYLFTINAADLALAPPGSGYTTCDINERHEVWWKRTAGVGDSLFIFGVRGLQSGVTNYLPNVSVWIGTPPALTEFVITIPSLGIPIPYCAVLQSSTFTTTWFRLPVVPGTTYYFQVVALNPDPVDTDLIIEANNYPAIGNFAPDDFVINDDTYGFPAINIDPITGATKSTLPIPSTGEIQAALPSRLFILNPNFSRGVGLWGRGEIYDTSTMTLVAGYFPSFLGATINDINIDQSSTHFYNYGADATNNYIDKIDSNGNIVQSWIIPLTTIDLSGGFNTIDRDGTIIYSVDINDTQRIVKRYDLINGIVLSDFFTVSNLAQENIALLLVSFSGLIVIGVRNFITGDNPYYVYNAVGGLVNSVSDIGYFVHRAAIFIDKDKYATWNGGTGFRIHSLPSLAETLIIGAGSTAVSSVMGTIIAAPSYFVYSDSCPLIILPPLAIIPPPFILNPGSGIYKIVPGKRNDTLWNDTLTDTLDVKIP